MKVLVCAPQSRVDEVGGSMGEFLGATLKELVCQGIDFDVISQETLLRSKSDNWFLSLLWKLKLPWLFLYWIIVYTRCSRTSYERIIAISQEYILPFSFGRQIVYFYDAIQYFFPRNLVAKNYYRLYLRIVGRRCSLCLCPSVYSGRIIQRIYGIKCWRLFAIPARSFEAGSMSDQVRFGGNSVRPVRFVWVGTLATHKRFAIYLRLLSRLGDQTVCVAVVPARDVERARRLASVLAPNINLLLETALSHDQLKDLYCRAGALVSTSRVEGYGMPILEAALSGCDLHLTSNSVNRELFARLKPTWIDSNCSQPHTTTSSIERVNFAKIIDADNDRLFRQELRRAIYGGVDE